MPCAAWRRLPAGSGSIFEALRLRLPLVVVPNPLLMDNHQAELATKVGFGWAWDGPRAAPLASAGRRHAQKTPRWRARDPLPALLAPCLPCLPQPAPLTSPGICPAAAGERGLSVRGHHRWPGGGGGGHEPRAPGALRERRPCRHRAAHRRRHGRAGQAAVASLCWPQHGPSCYHHNASTSCGGAARPLLLSGLAPCMLKVNPPLARSIDDIHPLTYTYV